MHDHVRTQRDSDVLVIRIDHPPVNAASLEVRAGLLEAIAELAADASLQAGVIVGAGRCFIAGSDLREFGSPLQDPQLPAVIAAIEACSKPVVAALHGAALGGGFELALGCDARVALKGAVVGLPEVTLGMVPGAGGTQRLPRLVGVAHAIEIICSGERIDASQAARLGIVDALVDDDLSAAATAFARGMAGRKRRLRDETPPAAEPAQVEAAATQAIRQGRSRPQVLAAVEAVRWSTTLPVGEALQRERACFQELRLGREAFAMRHLFFAEREAAGPPDAPGHGRRAIDCVAVVGAGTMGTGIALSLLESGLAVVLLEQDAAALDRGHRRIVHHFDAKVAAGKADVGWAAACAARLRTTTDWAAIAQADAVIEAVYEDLGVKQQVFACIGAVAKPGALLATNTSYLDVDTIAAASGRPADVIGLHFFSPAERMKLLEVVRASASSHGSVSDGVTLAKRLGKVPVVAHNAFGFIGNRVYAAYRGQCEFMLEEGATPEQVDRVLASFGMAMGPFAVADLSGLDIAWRMRKAQAATRDPTARYVDIPDRLCEQGRLGRKSGLGYYRYDTTTHKGQPDAAVTELVEQASRAKGMTRRVLTDDEIRRRALLAMVNAAASLVAEGVARHAEDVDVVFVHGYGFPSWEGGPVFWARERVRSAGEDVLAEDLRWLAERSGAGFVAGDWHALMPSRLR